MYSYACLASSVGWANSSAYADDAYAQHNQCEIVSLFSCEQPREHLSQRQKYADKDAGYNASYHSGEGTDKQHGDHTSDNEITECTEA